MRVLLKIYVKISFFDEMIVFRNIATELNGEAEMA